MAYEMPIDVDYFDHPKTLRLIAMLQNPQAGVFPIHLWAWAAKYARAGKLPQDVAAIEGALRWDGEAGALHGALIAAGFIDPDGVTIHDWHEYTGRSIALYESKKAKKRAKYDAENGISSGIVPEQFRPSSGTNVPTQLTQLTQLKSTRERTENTKNGATAPALASGFPAVGDRGGPPKAAGSTQMPEDVAEVGSVPATLAAAYRAGNPGLVANAKAQNHIRAALAVGVDPMVMEQAFMDAKNRGRKIWEILDDLRPKPGGPLTAAQIIAGLPKPGSGGAAKALRPPGYEGGMGRLG